MSAKPLGGSTRKQKRRKTKKKGTTSKFRKGSKRGRNQPGRATEESTGKPTGSYGCNTMDNSGSATG